MIGVEAAVNRAIEALPSFLGGREPRGVRVEEVLAPEEGNWRVTLSYLEPGDPEPEPLWRAMAHDVLRAPPRNERVLRVIAIDADSGEATSMRRLSA